VSPIGCAGCGTEDRSRAQHNSVALGLIGSDFVCLNRPILEKIRRNSTELPVGIKDRPQLSRNGM
jgi:hypothetical protein